MNSKKCSPYCNSPSYPELCQSRKEPHWKQWVRTNQKKQNVRKHLSPPVLSLERKKSFVKIFKHTAALLWSGFHFYTTSMVQETPNQKINLKKGCPGDQPGNPQSRLNKIPTKQELKANVRRNTGRIT